MLRGGAETYGDQERADFVAVQGGQPAVPGQVPRKRETFRIGERRLDGNEGS
jgi:hypothetical protein